MNLYLRMLWLGLTTARRAPLGLWDTARLSFRVTPTDLDVLRHMNNGKYLTIMDLGRVDLLRRCGLWARFTERGWYPVLAGLSITYRRSLTLGQRFDLETRLLGYHDRWVYVEQVFRVGETVHAQAVVRARFLSRGGGTVAPEELLAVAGDPPADRVVPDWVIRWTGDSRVVADPASTP